MIPKPDQKLTPTEQARWAVTKAAATCADLGIPLHQVMADAREGWQLGWNQSQAATQSNPKRP